MTCREFKHSAASLTLWELTPSEDHQTREHSEQCEPCTAWLRKQRTLAASIQTLQARTASLEAGPDVERALLRAFRQDTLRSAAPGLRGVKERRGPSRPVVTPLSTPVALRMSHFFEIGAYAAMAAALLVGIFLGVRLLRQSPNKTTAQGQVEPANVQPGAQKSVAVPEKASIAEEHPQTQTVAVARKRVASAGSSTLKSAAEVAKVTNDDSQSMADAGYTALMLCDPLSCAADTEVVRVELPAAGGQSSQPQMADLVVGYDGVVRAVRMVN
jgi:hypothetical protein